MPLCQVFTNVPAPAPPEERALLGELSRLLAARFDKPERWVMTCLVPGLAMTFGGTSLPTAFVAVKNVGTMEATDTATLSRELCERLEKTLGVPRDRVYVEFTDAVGYLWGWNGATFA
jgi:phenylpyruvate tautomerase